MTVRDFEQRLVTTGLMTHQQATESRIAFLAAAGKSAAEPTPQDWGKFLVQNKKATMFQVSAIFANRPTRLLMGTYELLDKLATGGMGDVYRALDRKTNTIAVVKVLPASSANDEEMVLRFQREVKLLRAVEHPNIVGAFAAGKADGCHFLAMEYVDGADLGRTIKSRGPMSPEDALETIRQAAVGLAFAHEKGVIHRDVKPSNFMLDQSGMVKILDLGLARILHNEDGLTSTGSVLGSIDYMAPEQGTDSKVADHRADIYALGCTLYYLISGKIPFDGKNLGQKLMAHQDTPAPTLTSANPAVPAKLDQLYLKMMAKAPKDRPTRMSDVLTALKKLQTGMPTPDLSKYVRGSSNKHPTPEKASVAYGSTQRTPPTKPATLSVPKPTTQSQSVVQPPPAPKSPTASFTMEPIADLSPPPVPQWRVWLSSGVAATLVAAMIGWLLFVEG
jgi:serine/threonine protein kinase